MGSETGDELLEVVDVTGLVGVDEREVEGTVDGQARKRLDRRTDPQLDPLGDYGGPTLTHSVQPGSPVIDAGICGSFTADQRGVQRPIDIPGETNAVDGCDIGAFESELGPTQEIVEVPVRWCGVRGAPSDCVPYVPESHALTPRTR